MLIMDAENKEGVFCVNCKWCSIEPREVFTISSDASWWSKIFQPFVYRTKNEYICRRPLRVRDRVTGKPSNMNVNRLCDEERYSLGTCGRAGLYFESADTQISPVENNKLLRGIDSSLLRD